MSLAGEITGRKEKVMFSYASQNQVGSIPGRGSLTPPDRANRKL